MGCWLKYNQQVSIEQYVIESYYRIESIDELWAV